MRRLFVLGISIAALMRAADTRIADAAERGDREAVRSLLQQKADVNGTQGDGSTALHWAAYKDDAAMTKTLVAAGANVKAATRVGAITPLLMAAKNGDAAIVETLLAAGANANSENEHGTTALMMAAASGSADAVKSLVLHGADVNAKEAAHGQTALMFAAALGRADAIKVLVEHGANPAITTKAEKLTRPASTRQEDMPAPKEAPKPSATSDKASVEALATAMGFRSAAYVTGPTDGVKDMVQKLSAKVDEMEKRIAPVAPKQGDDDPARPPRERGTLDLGGMTALLFAARDGHIEAARALLEGGADINQVSTSEKTSALVMAALNGHFDLAKFLVDWGANPNLGNTQGLTALYAAVDLQWAPRGWFPEPITAQEKISYLDLMKALMDAGADPNVRLGKKLWFRSFGDHSWIDPAGATAFWRAAQSSDVVAMKLLVDRGADPDIPSTGGATPLMVAAGIGWGYHYSMNLPDSWMAAVKFCVEHGADVNAADSRGYTPLHGAAYLGNHEMIQYLIDHGADVKAVAKDKNTVADMANGPTRFGIPHPETVALLEKLGSGNSHNCRSDQCLVNPKEDKKPTPPPGSQN